MVYKSINFLRFVFLRSLGNCVGSLQEIFEIMIGTFQEICKSRESMSVSLESCKQRGYLINIGEFIDEFCWTITNFCIRLVEKQKTLTELGLAPWVLSAARQGTSFRISFLFHFVSARRAGREVWKDQDCLAGECTTENALRVCML